MPPKINVVVVDSKSKPRPRSVTANSVFKMSSRVSDGDWFSVFLKLLSVDEIWSICSMLENICRLTDTLLCFTYCITHDDIDVNFNIGEESDDISMGSSALSSSQSEAAFDVTEEDMIQLAAETQNWQEQENFIENLNTMRKEHQEEIIISLKPKIFFSKSKNNLLSIASEASLTALTGEDDTDEDLLSDDDDLTLSSNTSSSISIRSESEDELELLPREKCQTYPAKKIVKEVQEPVMQRTRSVNFQDATKQEKKVPKKSRSLPDVAEETKGLRKKQAKKPSPIKTPPWLPSGTTAESKNKNLRKKVLTKAAEWTRKSMDHSDNSKPFRKTGNKGKISQSILEKTKIFSDKTNIATVIRRQTSNAANNKPKLPWGYGGRKNISTKPLPTLKPFVLRKAAKKHELGLNRSQLQDLKSGLSKVLVHDFSSCPTTPNKFSSLGHAPLNRIIPSSAPRPRVENATYSSSSESQTEYQGCEVCRLKEAMRNSPVSHKLKQTTHHCKDGLHTRTITGSSKTSKTETCSKKLINRRSLYLPKVDESKKKVGVLRSVNTWLLGCLIILCVIVCFKASDYSFFVFLPICAMVLVTLIEFTKSSVFKSISKKCQDKDIVDETKNLAASFSALSWTEKAKLPITACKAAKTFILSVEWDQVLQNFYQDHSLIHSLQNLSVVLLNNAVEMSQLAYKSFVDASPKTCLVIGCLLIVGLVLLMSFPGYMLMLLVLLCSVFPLFRTSRENVKSD